VPTSAKPAPGQCRAVPDQHQPGPDPMPHL